MQPASQQTVSYNYRPSLNKLLTENPSKCYGPWQLQLSTQRLQFYNELALQLEISKMEIQVLCFKLLDTLPLDLEKVIKYCTNVVDE